MADDELVILEKVEFKEVYGKKKKIEEMQRKESESIRIEEFR